MANAKRTLTVNGTPYEVWSDFTKRATMARNTQTDETKPISGSGYVSADLTVRKAIATVFRLPTFKKEAAK